MQSCARAVMAARFRVVTSARDSARGWNADQFGCRLVPAPSTAPVLFGDGGAWNGVGVGFGVVGTLLGPEGAGPVPLCGFAWVVRGCCLVQGFPDLTTLESLARGREGSVGEVGWLVVENCTVDASIFDSAPAHPVSGAGCLVLRSGFGRWWCRVGGFVECL